MLTPRLGNWLGHLGWGLLASALAAAACGTKDEPPPVTGTGLQGGGARMNLAGRGGKGSGGGAGEGAGEGGVGDVSATGGSSVSGGTSGTGGSGGNDVTGAPVVHVTSPVAVTDPNDRAVIVADEIDALCTATKSPDKGAKPVDDATVLLELLDGDGLVVETHPGTPTDNENEYTAHFITRKVTANGGMSIECQASDTGSPAIMGTDRIDTFVDHGPTITPVDPPVGDADNPPFATAVGQALHVAFKVAEAPVVSKGDKGAAIGDVTLTVGGKPFDLTKSNGQYTATVHLDDPKIFTPTPDGDQKIVITAGDQRSPTAAVNQVAYDFIVDGTGPAITIVSPHAGDVRSGKVQFVIKIIDSDSGVDPLSVVATINNSDYAYSDSDPSWSYDPASGTFTFYFDTTQIENSVAQATLRVVASDKVGNSAKASVLLQLDNVPPIVELDPLPVREHKPSSNTCSLAFDPVGPAAASDLDVVLDFQVFRALVWEETNHARGETNDIAAGADLGSVVLYLQPNIKQGLLKDTNGDGYCDALETTDADTGKDLHSIALKPIMPQGSSWFGPESKEITALNTEYPMPACDYENAMTEPTKLCPPSNSSDMTRVISWDIDHTVPAIFGVEPIAGVSCTGYGWEINAVVSEGWLCAAATAKDNNGNVGISVPIRLCYDDGKDPAPACANSSSTPPSCVEDGCTLPPRLGSGLLEP